MSTDGPSKPEAAPSNFIRDIIDKDLEAGKYGGRVVTRFPPEPNGYLHIGHAKSICLNFGLARDYDGTCHLRFDDTNPSTEEVEYVENIQSDIKWLGFDWGEDLYFASDYFQQMYDYAEGLIKRGKAYVDSATLDEIRERRGSVSEPGTNSPDRDRSIEENLDLFRRMKAGEFPDGAYVLRAKGDMAAANMKMRDPLLYRIRHEHHYRTGDDWCLYPFYDYAHCLEDAFEGVTHSICTLEFENNREVYDWVLEEGGFAEPLPKQYEFARLGLNYTVMSKRRFLQLVNEGHVAGWDDPRMPTLAGLRRRGYTPDSIRRFCDLVGVAKANSTVDVSLLEYAIRDDLNHKAPRVMAVLDPLKVTITNYPEGETEMIDASLWPHDVPREGTRPVPFSRELYIERSDFHLDPPKKYRRLAPGREVRLRYAYLIKCDEVIEDASGEVVELRCTYDPVSRDGKSSDGRKVKGIIHWVSVAHAVDAEVRLYDRLFRHESPGKEDFLEALNPHSLELIQAKVEPSLAGTPAGEHVQFERTGYFFTDPDTTSERLVFNRVVGLRDSWAKSAKTESSETKAESAKKPASKADRRPKKRSQSETLAEARNRDPKLAARYDAYLAKGLSKKQAELAAADHGTADFFDATLAVGAPSTEVAKWFANELPAALDGGALGESALEPRAFGVLIGLVSDGKISGRVAKELLAELVTKGGDPEAIVAERGLEQVSDASSVEPLVDQVLAANPDNVAKYREGKASLFGFFVGQVMKASRGAADPKLVNQLLRAKLD